MSKECQKYSGIYRDMVEILGVETTLKVYEEYRGQTVTFPMRIYSTEYVVDYLKKHYNGKNIKDIAKKLNYTVNWLKQIIKKNNIKINKMED